MSQNLFHFPDGQGLEWHADRLSGEITAMKRATEIFYWQREAEQSIIEACSSVFSCSYRVCTILFAETSTLIAFSTTITHTHPHLHFSLFLLFLFFLLPPPLSAADYCWTLSRSKLLRHRSRIGSCFRRLEIVNWLKLQNIMAQQTRRLLTMQFLPLQTVCRVWARKSSARCVISNLDFKRLIESMYACL